MNLLGGRALWREMFPLTPEELGADFDLDRVLELGALPLVLDAPSPGETLRSYVQLYLREEIKGEALVRNLPGFARFLPVAALFHGQQFNLAGLARDAGVARKTVEGWIHTLLRTYMGERALGEELAYWAPAESRQREVDFVLRRGADLCALEVKSARRAHPADLAGLRAIAELPGLRRRVLVHRGERPARTEDGIDVWPIATLLEALESGELWPELR